MSPRTTALVARLSQMTRDGVLNWAPVIVTYRAMLMTALQAHIGTLELVLLDFGPQSREAQLLMRKNDDRLVELTNGSVIELQDLMQAAELHSVEPSAACCT